MPARAAAAPRPWTRIERRARGQVFAPHRKGTHAASSAAAGAAALLSRASPRGGQHSGCSGNRAQGGTRGTCAWVSHANGTSRRGSASCAAIDKSARGRARGAISAHRHASMPRRQGRTARGPTAAITRRKTRGRGDGVDERRWLVSTSRRARVGYRLLRGDADHDRRVVRIADVDCGRAGGAPARATAAESELSKGRTRHASVAAAPASFRARPVVTC